MATSTQVDQIQRLIYGASTASGTLSTGDLGWFADSEPNIYLAAAAAANAEAMKAVSGGDKQVGDLRVDYSGTAGAWRMLAKALRMRGVRSVTPYSGGRSVSDKNTALTDSDFDKPKGRSGQFDYPSSTF